MKENTNEDEQADGEARIDSRRRRHRRGRSLHGPAGRADAAPCKPIDPCSKYVKADLVSEVSAQRLTYAPGALLITVKVTNKGQATAAGSWTTVAVSFFGLSTGDNNLWQEGTIAPGQTVTHSFQTNATGATGIQVTGVADDIINVVTESNEGNNLSQKIYNF